MYYSAPINTFYNPSLAISDSQAELNMDVKPEFFHTARAIHGSVYFKCLDDSAYFASQSVEHEFFMLTSSFTTHFIRPISEGRIIAKGLIISNGKSQIIAESKIFNEQKQLLAYGSGTFVKSKHRLREISSMF
ncbi:thioesterase [Candidatus Marinamargulisbacteria bacterium SCGC AG-343-D04]|nr:thioesterase [Candidatus Marinamargulisbacteria bacterium SCGC AG-343-D04]